MPATAKKHNGHPKFNVCNSNTTLEELKDIYNSFAKDYEAEFLAPIGFNGPKASATVLDEHLKKKYKVPHSLRILDVGAGTGAVGEQLRQFGYNNIDALDASAEMLKVAEKKNIYKSSFVAYLGVKPANTESKKEGSYFTIANAEDSDTPLPENVYDATICSGCFTFGHIKGDGFDDMVRMTKPGGTACFTVRPSAMAEESLGYQSKIDQLINSNRWKLVSKTEEQYYIPQDDNFIADNCYVFVFEVL